MQELITIFFIIAAGFVSGGVIGSFYQLITKKTTSFHILNDLSWQVVPGVFALVFAGPVVIMRNAYQGRVIDHRPFGWIMMSSLIAASWSFLSGLFIMDVLLSL